MKIQDMELVTEVIRAGSISAAAKSLFVSQPSLSQSIRKIEEELGVRFFVRQKGKVVELTQEGRDFAQMAEKVLPIYRSYLEDIQEKSKRKRSCLKIGVPFKQGNSIMEILLSHSGEFSHEIDMEFFEGTALEHERSVMNGDIDVAVIRLPLSIKDLRYHVVYREQLGVWLRKGAAHEIRILQNSKPAALYPSINIRDLADEPFILPPEGKRIRATINRIFAESGLCPNVLRSYENRQTIMLLVESGVCSTIGKCPEIYDKNAPFYWIEGCNSYYDLALVYPDFSEHKREIRILTDILKSFYDCYFPQIRL